MEQHNGREPEVHRSNVMCVSIDDMQRRASPWAVAPLALTKLRALNRSMSQSWRLLQERGQSSKGMKSMEQSLQPVRAISGLAIRGDQVYGKRNMAPRPPVVDERAPGGKAKEASQPATNVLTAVIRKPLPG